jgi:hypothetical protein
MIPCGSNFSPRHFVIVMVALWTSFAARAEVVLQFDTNHVNQLSFVAEADGAVAFKTLGEDPFILLAPFESSALTTDDQVLAFEYFCPDGINGLEIYYGPPIRAGQSLSAGEMGRAESWQSFAVNLKDASNGQWSAKFDLLRLDFGRRAGVELRIRNLRLRPPTAAEQASTAERERIRNRKRAAAKIVTQYLEAEMPIQIESVVVEKERIEVSGRSETDLMGELRLIEVRPWQELWNGDIPVAQSELGSSRREETLTESSESEIQNSEPSQSLLASATTLVMDGRSFSASVPRFEGERDRITSRWAVIEKQPDESGRLVSHYVYPTDLSAACENPDLDRKIAGGIKGMGGVWANDILDELVELGVKHITDNIWISGLLSDTEQSGGIAFRHNGKNWWADLRVVDGHDRLIKFATDNGIVVSAIILVGFGHDGFAGTLQHPDADRAGQYAMPNLTTAEGVAAYEAAIYFLAQRYAQPGDPHGRISNWIMHNEVDYGWEWTNMGEQPMPVFLDTYARSMRIVHNVVRQFSPHARTFISLTHNWEKPEDPAWKIYSPKRLLEMLAKFSQVEGDFEWGVAYHPYPQSLFKADAWNDTRVTHDFDTPLITPKNIAVLDRWMHRTEMLFDEKPRGVMLSEQGFHTNDYSDEGERLQAAAFVYMWHQMRGLESIESFQNHRWVDHPQEGGLRLGVRTLPTEGRPYGEKKFGWEIYKVLDTPEEAAATEFAKEIIGIESFDETTNK